LERAAGQANADAIFADHRRAAAQEERAPAIFRGSEAEL
jgi:hypothetical protein